jgi:hypothetical protein
MVRGTLLVRVSKQIEFPVYYEGNGSPKEERKKLKKRSKHE